MADDALQAEVERLKAENAALQAQAIRAFLEEHDAELKTKAPR